MYITKKEFNGRNSYSTTCKDRDKNLVYFMDLQFPRDNDPQGTDIKITDFFMSCYQSKDGIKPKMVIKSYIENEQDGQATPNDFSNTSTSVSDEPFKEMGSQFDGFGETVELSEDDIQF